jgi:TonB family protein
MKSSLVGLTLFSTVLFAESEPVSSVELVESVIPAKPVERIPPKYPINAARKGNEGWVKLSFVVDEKGNVVDPIVEDSSGIRGFEKASLVAIKQWQYSPAVRDGKNIEQCRNSVQLDFVMGKTTKGARSKFVRNYKKANEALEAGDIKLADELVSKMESGKIWNRYEDTWFWMLKATLAKAHGHEDSQLNSLRRAVSPSQSNEYIGDNSYLYLLRQKFALEIKASLYSDALQTFAQISQQPDSEETVTMLEKYATKVRDILKNEDFVVINGEIDNDGDWWHSLSRNRFSFTNVIGTLDSVELRCANKREKYTVAEDTEWKIPESWGRCRILVVGDEQTNFNLVEIRQDA